MATFLRNISLLENVALKIYRPVSIRIIQIFKIFSLPVYF